MATAGSRRTSAGSAGGEREPATQPFEPLDLVGPDVGRECQSPRRRSWRRPGGGHRHCAAPPCGRTPGGLVPAQPPMSCTGDAGSPYAAPGAGDVEPVGAQVESCARTHLDQPDRQRPLGRHVTERAGQCRPAADLVRLRRAVQPRAQCPRPGCRARAEGRPGEIGVLARIGAARRRRGSTGRAPVPAGTAPRAWTPPSSAQRQQPRAAVGQVVGEQVGRRPVRLEVGRDVVEQAGVQRAAERPAVGGLATEVPGGMPQPVPPWGRWSHACSCRHQPRRPGSPAARRSPVSRARARRDPRRGGRRRCQLHGHLPAGGSAAVRPGAAARAGRRGGRAGHRRR